MTPPKDVALKDPKDFKLISKPTKRLDTSEKINGTGVFGLDVTVPGMRHVVQIDRGVAVVAKISSDAKLRVAMPGVRDAQISSP